MTNELMSDQAAADLLGIGRMSMHMLAKTGKVPAVNVSRSAHQQRFLFRRDDLNSAKAVEIASQLVGQAVERYHSTCRANIRNKQNRVRALDQFIRQTGLVQRDSFGLRLRDGKRIKTRTSLQRAVNQYATCSLADCQAWLDSEMPSQLEQIRNHTNGSYIRKPNARSQHA